MATMTVYVCPQFRVEGCATKRAEEDRGLMGFHAFSHCPACRVIPESFELWGDNGHRQGSIALDADLGAALDARVRMVNGMSDRCFKAGHPIYYRGAWRDEAGPAFGTPPRD